MSTITPVTLVAWAGTPLIAEDVVLPSQVPSRRRTSSPERELLAALLDDAIRCAVGLAAVHHTESGALLVQEARAWIAGAHARLTFVDVCDGLGLDPVQVRRALIGREARAIGSAA